MKLMVSDLSIGDLFETKRLSPLSDFDEKVVVDLYMPLVGAKAVSLYLYLYQNEPEAIANHEKLLRNTSFSLGEVVAMLNALEAVALIKTFLGESEKFRLFDYCLYAPLSPRAFFADPLYAGTLEKYIGKDDCKKLAKKYSFSKEPENFKNVSMDFVSYFSPDVDDSKYAQSVLTSGGKKAGKASISFDFTGFLNALKEIDSRYEPNTFSREEISYIERVSALYGYSTETLAGFANDAFLLTKPYGKRLDKKSFLSMCQENVRFDYLRMENKERRKNPIHGDTSIARMVRKMQNTTPIEFLSFLQKGNKPASSDISLVQELTLDIGLNNEVTNALLFYVLSTQNNTLPRAYTEKVGASLVREGLETALDTMNFFTKTNKTKTRKTITIQQSNIDKKPLTKDTNISISSSSKEETFDDLFAEIEKK